MIGRRSLVAAIWIATGLLLLWPALANRFPVLFPDSRLFMGITNYPPTPPFYTFFVSASSVRFSLWLTLVVQAMLTLGVLGAFFARFAGLRPGAAGLASLLLVAGSQLPWLVSWIMPDWLAGCGVLAALALLTGPQCADGRATKRPWAEPAILAVDIGLAGIVAMAALVASASLVVLAMAIGLAIAGRFVLTGAVPIRAAVLSGAALGGSALLLLLASHHYYGSYELNRGSPVMMFARLADTHVADPVLRAECARPGYPVCDYLPELLGAKRGRQAFLWDGPAAKTDAYWSGRWQYVDLSRKILAERRWPFLAAGLEDGWVLARTPTLDGWTSEVGSGVNLSVSEAGIRQFYPQHLQAWHASRDWRGQLRPLFPGTLYGLVAWLAYLASVAGAVVAWRRGDRSATLSTANVIATVIATILLHATLVGPFPRYHAKVSWLALAMAIGLAARLRAHRSRAARTF